MFVFLLNSVLLGVGLTMDAFSVSLANGLNEPSMRRKKSVAIAGTYAFFQAFMPMTGWLLVHTALQLFSGFRAWIPWIALVLLLYIGGKMLLEGVHAHGTKEVSEHTLTPWELFVQGVATSIDALSVGFTIANYSVGKAVICSLIIAAVTFVACSVALKLGRLFGTMLAGRATILGGIILIGIGIEIFVTGVM